MSHCSRPPAPTAAGDSWLQAVIRDGHAQPLTDGGEQLRGRRVTPGAAPGPWSPEAELQQPRNE